MVKSIVEEIADLSSARALFDALKDNPYVFFLDSACDHEKLGGFSFLGCDPFLVFKSKRDFVTLEWADGKTENFKLNPFSVLKSLFKKYKTETVQGMPFTSGAVGYFAYDLKDFIENLPDLADDDLGLPDCVIGFYDVVIIRDNLAKKTYVASSGLPETDAAGNSRRKESRLKEFKNKLSARPGSDKRHIFHAAPSALRSNFLKTEYAEAIRTAKAYIKKGDIYQVNLSQRFEAKIDVEPAELYLKLRETSPAPFSAYLGFKDVAVLSSSPERFLLKKGDYVETRPIKGTRPRGEDASSDALLGKELSESPKDMAEHIMIVDLERNDLGRVCEYGSVHVSESFVLEKYANVFHLVSTVAGRLKKDIDPIDCLLAAFPGGSITGAPKVRSMEIIEELEPVKRSIYTGAIGYISFDGNMDTSIVIRTFLVKGDRVYFQVGGGIVADSDAEKEYEETIDKAQGLFKTLGITFDSKVMA